MNRFNHRSLSQGLASEWPGWDQNDSGSRLTPAIAAAERSTAAAAILNFRRLEDPAPLFARFIYPRKAPCGVEVSALFAKAWKKEVYEAWVDFDLVPAFMRGLDDEPERFELPWFLKLDDCEMRWQARTTECIPGDRISWEGGGHATFRNYGCVTFEPQGWAVTRVRVSLQFETHGASAITDQTLKGIELQLRDTLPLLDIFLAPNALPPALASL